MSNTPVLEAQPSSGSDKGLPPPVNDATAEPAVRASARTYEQWLHAIIHLPLLVNHFRHLATALDCFPKEDISVNEIFERLNSVVERGRIRGLSAPGPTTTGDMTNLQAQVRRLQDQVDNLQREQTDLWRELLATTRRDAPREQRVEPRRESAQRGWASNRDELFNDYNPRHDENARRGGGY